MYPLRYIVLIGLGQIISWGTLFYSLTILAQPILHDTLWPEWVVYGAFSLGLMLWGLGAPLAGKVIDDRGGRFVMSFGSLLAGVAFSILALADSVFTYILGWLLAGASMAMTLYDAVFAVMHRISSNHYRKNIALLTLMGGFASTVFWPLTFYLQQDYGWRGALWVFALLHLMLFLLYWRVLPEALKDKNSMIKPEGDIEDSAPFEVEGYAYSRMWLILSFSLSTIVFAALSVFMVDAMVVQGFPLEQAVWLAAVIGPAQALGRLIEWLFSHKIAIYWIGLASLCSLLVGLLALNMANTYWLLGFLFVVLYGLANGVMTLVRGALPIELYGPKQVGHLLGQLAKPVLLVKAITPGAIAFLLYSGFNLSFILCLLLLIAVLALISFLKLRF